MRLYTGVASATALQEVNEGIDSENENKLEKKYPLLRRGRNDHINEMSWLDLQRPSRLSRLNGGDSQVEGEGGLTNCMVPIL